MIELIVKKLYWEKQSENAEGIMKTRTILAKEVTPDMVVAEDVYTYSGQKIIPKGTTVSHRTITKMKLYSITQLTIQIENEELAEVDNPLEEAKELPNSDLLAYAQENKKKALANQKMGDEYIKIIQQTREYTQFNRNVYESAKKLEYSLSTFIKKAGQDFDKNTLINQTKEIIMMNQNPMNTFHILENVREYDDCTFIHSLNVAIICNTFGRWIHMSKEDLDILTLAGLLHDVGKMAIPENIIKKPEILTDSEYSVVKRHPNRGYHIVESMRIDERIKNAVLQHHERCDGSGYPYGLHGEQIDDFAKIVAIADIYDAMTSARVYRGPVCPFEVIAMFEREGYEKFEAKFIIPFLEGIVNSYLNSHVVLSDGREGRIVLNNKNALSRPIVLVGRELVDLSKEEDLSISRIA